MACPSCLHSGWASWGWAARRWPAPSSTADRCFTLGRSTCGGGPPPKKKKAPPPPGRPPPPLGKKRGQDPLPHPAPNWGVWPELLDDRQSAANLVTLLRTTPAARPWPRPAKLLQSWAGGQVLDDSANCCRPIPSPAAAPCCLRPCATLLQKPEPGHGGGCASRRYRPKQLTLDLDGVLALGAGWRRPTGSQETEGPGAAAAAAVAGYSGGPTAPMRYRPLQTAQHAPGANQPGPWPTGREPLPLEIWGASPSSQPFPWVLLISMVWAARRQLRWNGRRVVTARLAGAAGWSIPAAVMNQRCGATRWPAAAPRALKPSRNRLAGCFRRWLWAPKPKGTVPGSWANRRADGPFLGGLTRAEAAEQRPSGGALEQRCERPQGLSPDQSLQACCNASWPRSPAATRVPANLAAVVSINGFFGHPPPRLSLARTRSPGSLKVAGV